MSATDLYEAFTPPWAPHLTGRFEPEAPDPALVTNIRLACFVGEQVVTIDTEQFGRGALPGGGIDPGETFEEALARELREEIGGHALNHTVFGRIRFVSSADAPFKPHHPHPEHHWWVGYGDVVIDGEPTSPADAEGIISVDVTSLDRACEWLRAEDKDWDAQLLMLAAELRSRDA